MSVTVTQTKIHIPRRRADLLTRPRLTAALGDILDYPLVLISAPAGYGKTSLMIDLAHQAPFPLCWYSIDALDRDPQRFLTYLVESIRVQFPDCGEGFLSLLENLPSPSQYVDQLAAALANDLYLAVQEHFVLFLDDYHLIEEQQFPGEFLSNLAQLMDDNTHLVLASRRKIAIPGLPLLIGRKLVKGIDAEDLAFQPAEIKSYLELALDQPVSSQLSRELHASTEGWITGLLLLAHRGWGPGDNQIKAVRVSGANIEEYFSSQVLDPLSPQTREMMIITSQLDEIHLAACRQVFGGSSEISWEDFLELLLKNNLFVEQADTTEPRVRYHHLFRDYLQGLFTGLDQAKQEAVLTRLLDHQLGEEEWEKAFATAQKLRDPQAAAEVILQASSALFHAGRIRLLAEWLDTIPEEVFTRYPYLIALNGFTHTEFGKVKEGIVYLEKSIRLSSQSGDHPVGKFYIWLATANRLIGNYKEALENAYKGYNSSRKAISCPSTKAEAAREIGLAYSRIGDNNSALKYLSESKYIYCMANRLINSAQSEMDIGYIHLSLGKLQKSESHYYRALDQWKSLKNYYQLALVFNNLGYINILSGKYTRAKEYIVKSLELSEKASNTRLKAYSKGSLGDLAYSLMLWEISKKNYDEVLIISRSINDRLLSAYSLISIASIYRMTDEIEIAKDILDEAQPMIVDSKNSIESGLWHLENGFLGLIMMESTEHLKHFETALATLTISQRPFELAKAQLGICLCAQKTNSNNILEKDLDKLHSLLTNLETIQPLLPEVIRQLPALREISRELPSQFSIHQLLDAAENHLASLSSLQRRVFPHQASSPDPERISIQALGLQRVLKGGQRIKASEWIHQKMVRELLFYLLSQSRGVTKEQVGLVFWPDSSPGLLSCQFKNAVYRLRRALGKDCVLYDRDTRTYRFNREINYRYDVEEFTEACRRAEREMRPARKTALYRKAVSLYQHPFGPQLEGIWAEPIRRKLYIKYERSMLYIAKNSFQSEQYFECYRICSEVLHIDPPNEEAFYYCIRSLSALNMNSELLNRYHLYSRYIQDEFGIRPSNRIQTIFDELFS